MFTQIIDHHSIYQNIHPTYLLRRLTKITPEIYLLQFQMILALFKRIFVIGNPNPTTILNGLVKPEQTFNLVKNAMGLMLILKAVK